MSRAAAPRPQGARSRRLERACEHVEKLWFPINVKLLEQIQADLRVRGELLQAEALIARISSDASLFFFCLRESCRMLQEEGVTLPTEASPHRILEHAGIERLGKILYSEFKNITPHFLEQMTAFQRQRLEEMLISCSSAETLASCYDVEHELARCGALARQLGLTLIAWNYPEVFEQSLSHVRPDMTLDVVLSQVLGFSPLLLSCRLLQRWGLSASFTAALASDAEQATSGLDSSIEADGRAQAEAVEGTLVRLCKVGEALARANYPETYPSARTDWNQALEVIENHVGADGIDLIRDRLLENSVAYITLCPAAFKSGMVLEPMARQRQHLANGWQKGNPWVAQCSDYLRQRLESFYLSLPEAEVASKYLQLLVREVLPSAGFKSGCIFTLDPGTCCLMPRLAVGASSLAEYARVQHESDLDAAHAVAKAFNQRVLVVTRPTNPRDGFAYLSHVLGHSQRIGVLHLMLPLRQLEEDLAQQEVHIKAIAQALNDCLRLW